MTVATHNTHRTTVAFAWELTPQVWTGTPTVANEQQYAGTVTVYGPDGQSVASTTYDYESDVDATADEIVTGVVADLTGGDADDYVTYSGTATIIITCDSPGYTIVVTQTAGTITGAYTGAESAQGTTPADATEWAAEGMRMLFEAAPVDYIRGEAAVENVDLQDRVNKKSKPHKGLRTADGGTLVSRLWSSGTTSHGTDVQVGETALGKLLEHALGGSSRSEDTGITTVANQYSYTVDDATYLEVGQIIALEDSNGRLWPAQIITKSSADITVDRVQPWTIDTDTDVHGAECLYPEQAALTNAQDANYSTLSILYQYGPHLWMAGGAHLALDSISFERGQQPKLSWQVLAAAGHPQGDGVPSAPTWTNTLHGSTDVKAVGRLTKCFLQTYGTTTSALLSLYSATVTVGVPVLPQDGVTENDDGMPGRIGYRTEPAATIIELVVALEDAHQTRWTAGTLVTCTYFQVATKGYGWCVHIAKGFMMEPPTPANDGTNRWNIKIQATEPDTSSTTTEASKAKIMIALY